MSSPIEKGTFDKEAAMLALDRAFREMIPYSVALGITVVDCSANMAAFRLPYRANIIGDPENGVVHGGAITALLDNCCGAAVFMALGRPASIATLDLRIDYLRPAIPNLDVVARAECYRLTKSIAFVRGFAFHVEGEPIAAAAATFMLAAKGEVVVAGTDR